MTALAADLSPLKRLALLPVPEREAMIARYAEAAGLSVENMILRLRADWSFVGRPKQQPPPGEWMFWFIQAGRGFGKTISAAEWIKGKAEQWEGPRDGEGVGCRIALIAPTLQDVRLTMVEGQTGLLSILPPAALRGESRASAWNRTTCELYLANGTYLQGFSSDVPNRLRGPQHHYAWCEEVSSWLDARAGIKDDTTWSNMTLGLRLGTLPQAVLTSTPKVNKLTKELLAMKHGLRVVTGSSYENRDNLTEAWWNTVVRPLEGTRTGRQEILAELLEDVEGALWTLAQIEALRVSPADVPDLARIVVAVDPNVSSGEAANDAGVIVAGRGAPTVDSIRASGGIRDQHAYVLADRTVTKGGPRAWARAAVEAYHEFEADKIVAEKNNGGEMVALTIKTVDPDVPVKLVSASRGKRTRAEPVSALYEGEDASDNPPRAHHAGAFPDLEDEQTTWVPDPSMESPNRLDALVWALTELMLDTAGHGTGRVGGAAREIPGYADLLGAGAGYGI